MDMGGTQSIFLWKILILKTKNMENPNMCFLFLVEYPTICVLFFSMENPNLTAGWLLVMENPFPFLLNDMKRISPM